MDARAEDAEAGKDSIGAGGGVADVPAERAGVQRSCRVAGCTRALDPGYSTKYKICSEHAVVSSLEVDGQLCRFCQQCARFHPVTDFDNDRRSCRTSLERHRQRRQEKRRKSQPEVAAPAQPRAHQGAASASDAATTTDAPQSTEQEGGEGAAQHGKRQRREAWPVQRPALAPAPPSGDAVAAVAPSIDVAVADQSSMQQLGDLPSVVQQLVQLVQQVASEQQAVPPPPQQQQQQQQQQQPSAVPPVAFGGQQQARPPPPAAAARAAAAVPPMQQAGLAPAPALPVQLPQHHRAEAAAALPESRLFGLFAGQQVAAPAQGLQQAVDMLRAPQLPAALVSELTELRGGLAGGGAPPGADVISADVISEALRLMRPESAPATGWGDLPGSDELAALDSLLGIDLSNPAARAAALQQAMRLAQQGGLLGAPPPGGPPHGGAPGGPR